MRVTVQYLAQIKRAAECGSECVEGPDAMPLRDFLRALAALALLNARDNCLIMSPAESVAAFIATMRATCSLTAMSVKV